MYIFLAGASNANSPRTDLAGCQVILSNDYGATDCFAHFAEHQSKQRHPPLHISVQVTAQTLLYCRSTRHKGHGVNSSSMVTINICLAHSGPLERMYFLPKIVLLSDARGSSSPACIPRRYGPLSSYQYELPIILL